MGQATSTSAPAKPSPIPAGCPMHQEVAQTAPTPPAAIRPVEHDKSQQPAKCPVEHDKLNPLNQMPELANLRQPGQSLDLPTVRTESSIPRDTAEKWEYPSPQQFYNALVRKGW